MIERNQTMDLFKCAAALMIIALHTTRTFGTDSSFGFFVINIFCRMAVPYFAVCSGYFLSMKWKVGAESNGEFDAAIVKQFKSSLLFMWCGLLYI